MGTHPIFESDFDCLTDMDIDIEHVQSVTSEHPNFSASKLLKNSKWRVEKSGLDSAVVDLKLKKLSKIGSLSIGAHACAFVSVEVGLSAESTAQWYSLLPSTKFMEQGDARNGKNVDKVKLFDRDCFNETNGEKRWDLVRISCMQPFNRALQIGLNFVHLHHAADVSVKKEPNVEKEELLKQREREVLNKLKKRDVYNANEYNVTLDKSNIQSALEQQQKKKEMKVEVKDEFNADDFLTKRLKDTKPGIPVASSNDSANQSLRHRIDKCTLHNPLNYNTLQDQSEENETTFNKRKRKLESSASSAPAPQPPPKTPKMEAQMKLNEILKGVQIALSGFVNPERGRIRDQALSMGAKFDRDLTRMTTHLVCAFANTPKAKKFKNGFIVKKEWITVQHATKRRHGWRKYSWKEEDVDEEEEDLYVAKKEKQPEEQNPDEIDTDDEIQEALEKKKKQEEEETKTDEPERIIRNVPEEDKNEKSDEIFAKGDHYGCQISYSYTRSTTHCLAVKRVEPVERAYLFSPYIFVIGEDVDASSIDRLILKNGGAIDDRVDATTTHFVTAKAAPAKLDKDVVPVTPSWIVDSFRLGRLQSPFTLKYIPA